MGVIKFLLIAFLIFYLIVFIGRVAFRLWIRKIQRELENRAANGQGGFHYRQYHFRGNKTNTGENNRSPGEVKISGNKNASKKINDKIGDYVDYEEIK